MKAIPGRHENVDVLEDAARSDAKNALGRFDEVVSFTPTVFPSEVIDEAEAGAELLGFDEEASAIRFPFHRFHSAVAPNAVLDA